MVLWGNFPQKLKNHLIQIASAHIHIPKNNPAKFHDNLVDSLGVVVDNRFHMDVRSDVETYVRMYGRKDKGNLICPVSLKWRGIKMPKNMTNNYVR